MSIPIYFFNLLFNFDTISLFTAYYTFKKFSTYIY